MLARRPRPRPHHLEVDVELRGVVQGYLDQRWSPEQTARAVRVDHGVVIAVETISQALYSPQRVLQRDPRIILRTHRPHRRPHRRGEARLGRFVVPLNMIDDRTAEADDRMVAGHWEGDLIVGSFNRSAIGTLVERSTRFTILVHLAEGSRAHNLRDQLTEIFNQLPDGLRRSLTWDQGVEMCHHHEIAAATGMPVYFCHRGSPWRRPSNETPRPRPRQLPQGHQPARPHQRRPRQGQRRTRSATPQSARLANPSRPVQYTPNNPRVATIAGIRRATLRRFT